MIHDFTINIKHRERRSITNEVKKSESEDTDITHLQADQGARLSLFSHETDTSASH